ncbi:DUF397 domain-containing protein [Streptomyces sp. NPDC091292]|uniref:DUF397 domain-containing protein n=1 Tax=Streptomyces sp. NPDC091292 TaxID=3365991 RepID=UPI0038077019
MTTQSPHWFKSSYTNNGGSCVELAANLAISQGVVPVRDSKNLNGPVLEFPADTFATFVSGLKAGEFNI